MPLWFWLVHAPLMTEKWNSTSRAQKRLSVFENRGLVSDFRTNEGSLTGRLRMRSYEKIRRLKKQPLNTSVVKSRRLLWADHVARGPLMLKIGQILNEHPIGPRQLERPQFCWEHNVSMDGRSSRRANQGSLIGVPPARIEPPGTEFVMWR